ncbi:MAG: hypothetical protein ACRC3H_24165 [Lachnospiraceae bacterium]
MCKLIRRQAAIMLVGIFGSKVFIALLLADNGRLYYAADTKIAENN